MVAAAVGAAAVGSVAGAAISSNSAKKAANKQAQATTDAAKTSTDANMQMFNQLQENQQPYMQLGESSIGKLQSLLGSGSLNNKFSFSAKDLQNTPGYQFQLQQGNRAVNNQAAASGLNLSGAQLKGISEYTTGLADSTYNQQYNNALNTFQTNYGLANDQYNRLSGLVGLGQNAAAGVGNAGMQTSATNAGIINQSAQAGANASAAGTIASGNAYAGAANSLGQSALLYSLMK